jgi:hypothetical protein
MGLRNAKIWVLAPGVRDRQRHKIIEKYTILTGQKKRNIGKKILNHFFYENNYIPLFKFAFSFGFFTS